MDVQQILKWYDGNKYNRKFDPTLCIEYEYLLSLTSFLDLEYSEININQRIWHLKNNNFKIQRCKTCNDVIGWDNNHKIYPLTCCKSCQNLYSKTDEFLNNRKKTSIERYGAEHYQQTQEYAERYKATCLKKYDAENYAKTQEYKKKKEETCLRKYGVEHYTQTQEFKQKSKQTSVERYGAEHYAQTKEASERKKQTCLERYGQDSYSKTQEFKEKFERTNLERYGVKNYVESDEYKKKTLETSIERYGQDSYSKTDEAKKRAVERSKWFKLLEQGIGDAVYLKHLGGDEHLLKCKLCGQEFGYNSNSNRIFYNHTLCPVCNPVKKFYSQAEKELLSFIQSIYSRSIQENSRLVIPPYEVDIFLPDLKLAFEFNGLYFHSDLNKPDDYHKIKTELCEQAGVRLVHIFEDDWNFRRPIVKSIISNIISPQNNQKIQARKCEIREVNLQHTNDFLEQNHIQGGVLVQTICYGLYYDNILVSLMSLKKNKTGFELQRYGILLSHTIIGGVEKLWSHFLKNHDPEFAITYADISLFIGRVYQKLGFQKIRRNRPNYMFVDGPVRIPKQSIRKLKQGYKRQDDPYPRIYNSGIDVWEYHK